MKIRKATKNDFEELMKLKILSKKEELKYSETIKPLNESKSYYEEYLKIDLKKTNRAILVAEEDKKMVGMILGQFYKPLRISKYTKKGYISNLFVLKSYRNKGIGKKLIQSLMKWLRDNNVHNISLEIHKDNKAAQVIYHKLGFKDYTIKLVKKV